MKQHCPQEAGSLVARRIRTVAGWLLLALLFAAVAGQTARAAPRPGQPYERIVSLSPLLTENIYLLGAGGSLVGNTIYCKRPAAARDKVKVGSVQELSIEKIVALRPQLILASNLTPPPQVEKLQRLGYQVEIFRQPATFADICVHFLRLGQVLEKKTQAEAIVAQARHKVEAVRQAVVGQPRPKVFLQVGAHPLFSSVKSSFTNDYIELAGGINVAGDLRSGAVKMEQILALNPDLIIIAVMGTEHGVGAEEKRRWHEYPAIEAVRTGRVHVLDPDLVCSPSPLTFADTLVNIARLLHPEVAISP
ncbi:MAG: helical backbone metal receptor [Desulfobulbus sp.]|jgi:iron complex transport system substrate-binding protein|uniref:ABC transporter substrate-binding protein n=1 Tax=Desulfobulbus sp. TaxID=895 RepID=UPI00283AC43B|nr:helical backbone metal receptor [Desulfobulbus sp.]MDR2551166.1 helical backbone metal receptor [Desulfobulbus sp.]